VVKFDEARQGLSRILTRTREALDVAADALIEAATAYQMTDEQGAEAIRQINQIETPSAGPDPGRIGGV
jgi:hypothetical protein